MMQRAAKRTTIDLRVRSVFISRMAVGFLEGIIRLLRKCREVIIVRGRTRVKDWRRPRTSVQSGALSRLAVDPAVNRDVAQSCSGGSLIRIVEEELIAVGIIDHEEAVAPRTLLDRNVLGL